MYRHALRRPGALAVAVLVGLGAFATPLAASAEEDLQATLEEMTEFSPEDFVAEAAELPAELVEALDSDVDLTPEEFLAQGAAAAQAVEVVDSLESSGVDVLGSRMEGTELVVNVPTEADAATVESTGATAEIGEPTPGWDASGYTPEFAADLYSGEGWVWDDGTYIYQCSVGFPGHLVSSGANQFATAGHCTDTMSAPASIWNQSAPGQAGSLGAMIGSVVVGSTHFDDDGTDVGRVESGGVTQKSSVLTWGGGGGAPLASTPLALTGTAAPIIGSTLCKSGSRTGWACGAVVDVDDLVSVGGVDVLSVVARLCVLPGDSGGAGVVGNKAIGITSWTTTPAGCNYNYAGSSGSYAGFFQMISPGGGVSVTSVYSDWEMKATVSAPTITSISTSGGSATAINGQVPGGGTNYNVDIYLDGSSSVFTTAAVTASSGSWSASVSSVPAGLHTFTAVARFGKWSKSSATSGSFSRGVTVDRIDGADRFAVGVKIAQTAYPSGGAPVIFITTGYNYPDALSAAPAAALDGGLLMLTNPTSLPANVKAEIVRQTPAKIVVVGGVNSVSDGVFNSLTSLAPEVVRWAGADRFSASRAIVRNAFVDEGITPTTAYIATGYNFPDALSASGAGGAYGYPVILVPGNASSLDAATLQLLDDLGVTTVKIAGGPNSVSAGIFSQLTTLYTTVRLSGADRFEASKNIAVDAFGSALPQSAYIATGYNFPDALAGAPLAGMNSAPLIVVPTNCVPASTLSAIRAFTTKKITLLGGVNSLTPDVAALKSC